EAGDHPGRRVVGQVRGGVLGVGPHGDADGDRAGPGDRERPPGGAQAPQLDPLHPRHVREAVTAARNPPDGDGGHEVLLSVGRYSTAPLVSWKNASSSDSAPADSSATVVSASSRPRPITTSRSAVSAISLIRWLATNTVRPCAARDFSRLRIQRTPSGSSPFTGSSSSSTAGSPSRAAATPRRCAIPS